MGRLRYNGNEDILEVTVKDPTGAKIDSYICNINDKKGIRRIIFLLKNKYNVDFAEDKKEESSQGFLDF